MAAGSVPVHLVAFAPNGSFAVFGCGHRLRVFDFSSHNFVTADSLHTDGHEELVRCVTVSPSSGLLASLAEDKSVKLWDTTTWKCLSTGKIPKRGTSAAFSPDSNTLLVAEKLGDVLAYDVPDVSSKPQCILGHLSLVTDVIFSPDGQTVITCDKDEKIRVSAYPKCYNIVTYCLGHTDVVTRLVLPAVRPGVLVSGAADTTLMLWDYGTGKWVSRVNAVTGASEQSKAMMCEDGVAETKTPFVVALTAAHKTAMVAAVVADHAAVVLFSVEDSESPSLIRHQEINLTHAPLNVAFDTSDRLWVFPPSGDAVRVFAVNAAGLFEEIVSGDYYHSVILAVRAGVSHTRDAKKDAGDVVAPFTPVSQLRNIRLASDAPEREEREEHRKRKLAEREKRDGSDKDEEEGGDDEDAAQPAAKKAKV